MNLDTITLFQFDHSFYIGTYTDLSEEYDTKEKSQAHYLCWGKKEGRCCCLEEMNYRYKKNYENAIESMNDFQNTSNKFFNILIRTSNRPEYFEKCIQSILRQNYTYFHVYVCYDKKESLSYLEKYDENPQITHFFIDDASHKKYKFNLYCNTLLDKVEKGYLLFLDDDNIFIGNRALEMINWCSGDHKIITWNFLRPDRLIYKSDINSPLNLGEIDTSNVCICSSIKNDSSWTDEQYGDYNYYKPLFDNYESKEKFYFDYTLTSTQFNNKIGNFGKNI
jgi:glycosyltransferase involved in cell wall biosynthesis